MGHEDRQAAVAQRARVTLIRRLAVIMHAMLRDGTLFQARDKVEPVRQR